VIKCRRAIKQTGAKTLVLAGGVSANRRLRASMQGVMQKAGGQAYYPRPELCTDNGAMIAYAGLQRLLAGQHEPLTFAARPRWPMTELASLV
jgi:N6-L-threonylcarbamoyladenine synthase